MTNEHKREREILQSKLKLVDLNESKESLKKEGEECVRELRKIEESWKKKGEECVRQLRKIEESISIEKKKLTLLESNSKLDLEICESNTICSRVEDSFDIVNESAVSNGKESVSSSKGSVSGGKGSDSKGSDGKGSDGKGSVSSGKGSVPNGKGSVPNGKSSASSKEILKIDEDNFPVLHSESADDSIKNKGVWHNKPTDSPIYNPGEFTVKKSDKIEKSKDLRYERAVKKYRDEINTDYYYFSRTEVKNCTLKMVIHMSNSIINTCKIFDDCTHGKRKFVYETLYDMLWHNKYPGHIVSEESSFVQRFIDEFIDKYPELIKFSKPVDF